MPAPGDKPVICMFHVILKFWVRLFFHYRWVKEDCICKKSESVKEWKYVMGIKNVRVMKQGQHNLKLGFKNLSPFFSTLP
jgi:hypothetical protein